MEVEEEQGSGAWLVSRKVRGKRGAHTKTNLRRRRIMPQFLVNVAGKLLVQAVDKDAARTIAEGIIAARQPWLEVQYGPPTRVGETTDVPMESLVN